jgi:hypothetical protein
MKSRAKRPTIAAERVFFLRMAGSVRIGFPPAVLEAGARMGKRAAPRRGWFRRWAKFPVFPLRSGISGIRAQMAPSAIFGRLRIILRLLFSEYLDDPEPSVTAGTLLGVIFSDLIREVFPSGQLGTFRTGGGLQDS